MNKKVLAVMVLDESGSMQSIKAKTISCLNEYIQSLQPQGKSCHLTLVKFNTGNIFNLCENVPVKDVPKITEQNYNPNNGTPLLDAVGKTIKQVETYTKNSKENSDILFIVMTDGEENSSHDYNQKQIIDLISEKEKSGWTFVYLGANQDSWKSANTMGYGNAQNVANFVADSNGVGLAMRSLARSTHNYFSERQDFYKTQEALGANLNNISYQSKAFYGANNKNKKGVK